MTLTVLNVAYSLCAVGNTVGGAEQVLSAIDRALVADGATSIVVACEGSRTRGVLRATPAPGDLFDDTARAAAQAAHARVIAAALDECRVDVIHLHGVDFHSYLPPAGLPALATLHLPPDWYPAEVFAPTRPRTFVHCVSESQRRACPPSPVLLPTIPNGVEIPAGAPFRGERRGVVALGRICPEKGFHIALAAARRAGVEMTLAGRVFPYPAHLEYWAGEIMPRLDGARQFVGPVDAARRGELLARARCVLIPSLVDETSSLVAMESLAAGTPVVAFANGALPEIVDHGVTGFLVRDEQEMVNAIDAVATLDPDACRGAAAARFSVSAMTQRYLERYRALAHDAAHSLEQPRPVAILASRARPALEVAVLDTEAELRALVPEWRALATAGECTPFQRPEWILPWWAHFGTQAPAALTVRRGGELLGFAPLYVRPEPDGARVLALIGTGNTDYADVLAHPSCRREVAAAVLDHVSATCAEWDRCELGPLPPSSVLVEAAAPDGWQIARTQAGVCPVLALIGEPPAVKGSVRGSFLARLRNATRRLAKEHEMHVESAGPENAGALLEELCVLHEARWGARGEPGVLADARTRAFHMDVVTAMAEQDLLRLYVMRVDGLPAAAFYGFADGKRLYSYLGGFDPALARYSIGSLIILHAIEAAAARGAREVDFLRGREEYKYRWGGIDRPVYFDRLVPAVSTAEEAA